MESLEKKLGYSFQHRELLAEALHHSSYANEHRGAGICSNERLEFLGDSVLGFVTAEFLFKTYPQLPEGDLTRMRAALVCEQSLYEVARMLDLGQHLKLGKGEEAGGGRERQSILADAVEAVFAAVYLDGGMEESGPDHNKTFLFEVRLNGEPIGRGGGHSKKEAEQAAARDALERQKQ